MRLGVVGLGRMGGNMVRRLTRSGVEVVGWTRTRSAVEGLAAETGMIPASSLGELVEQLSPPRIVWFMLPAGEATEHNVREVAGLLEEEDIIVDGGNANYHDSCRRGGWLAQQGICFLDAGVSGGIWGLEEGYCLMVGGEPGPVAVVEPVLKVLAPSPDEGWAHVGPVGAGHFTKMVHNGIEYGMMQALAEGLALLRGKTDFDLDLAQVSELWRHGSVVRSWLLDLTAQSLADDQELADVAPVVADSGEGRWTVKEAVDQGVAVPVIALALQMRFASQDQEGYPNRALAMMRNAFGGHAVRRRDS